jgi:emp24/gp25L/p24 family/GOLD
VQVRDKETVIFSAVSVEDEEFVFHSKTAGKHAFCLTASAKSKRTRGRKWIPMQIDITVGETWSHDRVITEHLDDLMDDISDLGEQIQRLHSDISHFKYREARHRCALPLRAAALVLDGLIVPALLVTLEYLSWLFAEGQ